MRVVKRLQGVHVKVTDEEFKKLNTIIEVLGITKREYITGTIDILFGIIKNNKRAIKKELTKGETWEKTILKSFPPKS